MASTSYDISGTIKRVMETQAFASGFTKREFVVHTEEDYPQDVKLQCVKDRCAMLDNLKEGDRVTVSFSIRGNEHNGRFYVDLQAWRIKKPEGEAAPKKAEKHSDLEPTDVVDDIGADDVAPF